MSGRVSSAWQAEAGGVCGSTRRVRATCAPAIGRLDALADDVGRLRRRLSSLTEDHPETYTAALVERISDQVEALDVMFRPTAAERVRAGVSVDAALAEVDGEGAVIRRRLGVDRRERG